MTGEHVIIGGLSLEQELPIAPPSGAPSIDPSTLPSFGPSDIPSVDPSSLPSVDPSILPSVNPSSLPSVDPSILPSVDPSILPSVDPSILPSVPPSLPPLPSIPPSVAPNAARRSAALTAFVVELVIIDPITRAETVLARCTGENACLELTTLEDIDTGITVTCILRGATNASLFGCASYE